jgi:hypothetical protein
MQTHWSIRYRHNALRSFELPAAVPQLLSYLVQNVLVFCVGLHAVHRVHL